jgi:undecaprenyl-diphosphatase
VERPAEQSLLERLILADRALSARVAVPAGLPRWLAHIVAHSGDSAVWLGAAAAAILWGSPAWRSFGLRTLFATVVGALLATTIKFIVRRRRPGGPAAGLYASIDQHAFPSGHATRIGCMIAVLSPLLPGWGLALFSLWGGLVCLARVALQVHYFFDVIAGLAVGGLAGLLFLALI